MWIIRKPVLLSLVCLYTVCACILPIHTGSQSRVISSKGSSDVTIIWISALQTHFAMLLDSGPFPSLIEVSLMSNYIMNFMGLITIKRRSWGKKQLTVQAGILPCGSVRFWRELSWPVWILYEACTHFLQCFRMLFSNILELACKSQCYHQEMSCTSCLTATAMCVPLLHDLWWLSVQWVLSLSWTGAWAADSSMTLSPAWQWWQVVGWWWRWPTGCAIERFAEDHVGCHPGPTHLTSHCRAGLRACCCNPLITSWLLVSFLRQLMPNLSSPTCMC